MYSVQTRESYLTLKKKVQWFDSFNFSAAICSPP